jgi:hypothetical protein
MKESQPHPRARSNDKPLWRCVLLGLLFTVVAILFEYCLHLSSEVTACRSSLQTWQDDVKSSGFKKCLDDLRSSELARKKCLDNSKAFKTWHTWCASVHDEDFDACHSMNVEEFYGRHLETLNLRSLQSASADQLKHVRRIRKKQMVLAWHPDRANKSPLNSSVYTKIMIHFKDFDEQLRLIIEKKKRWERILRLKDKRAGGRYKRTATQESGMGTTDVFQKILRSIIETLEELNRRFLERLRKINDMVKEMRKRYGF